MKPLFTVFLLVTCIAFYTVRAQENNDSLSVIKVSSLTHPTTLNQYSLAAVDSSKDPAFKNIPSALFKNDTTDYYNNYIPLKDTQYPFYFSFTALNDTPKASTLFVYVAANRSVKLCATTEDGHIVDTLAIQHDKQHFIAQDFFSIALSPGQQQRYVLRVEFPESRMNDLNFWIGPSEQIESFITFYFGLAFERILYDSVFFGTILMMLIYMVSKYIQIRKPEYLYYAGYTFFFVLFFLLKLFESGNVILYFMSPALHSLAYIESQLLAYWMYYLFIQHYLNTKITFPRAHKIINGIIGFILICIVAELLLHSSPATFMLRWQVWDVARIVLIITGLSLTISFAFIGNRLSQYLVAGGSALAFFALLSMIFSFHPEWINDWPLLFSHGLVYFEIGIMLELLFFALGLGHKNKMDEIEKVEAKEELKHTEERQRIKHLQALSDVQEQERSRFAKDLHDGLGGMLSGIKLSLSNVKGNMILPGEQVTVFERSLAMLDNSITELRRVAHNMMPEALVKFGLSAALGDFCDFLNSSKVLTVTYQKIGNDTRLDISMEVVLYRITNELANNALRHSAATKLLIQLNYDDSGLMITVEDNGVGFDKQILTGTTGSGWPNIKSRIEYLKGTLDVETGPGQGTSVTITVPVPGKEPINPASDQAT